MIAADLPEPPTNAPVATLITETSISVSIDALPVLANGGSVVTGYIVQIDDGMGGTFTTVHDALTLDLIINGLQSGFTYRIRYTARNIVYDSNNMYACDSLNWSDSQYVLTAVTPSSPLNLRFDPTIRYKNSLIFKWDKPISNGGSPLQDYTLEIEDIA